MRSPSIDPVTGTERPSTSSEGRWLRWVLIIAFATLILLAVAAAVRRAADDAPIPGSNPAGPRPTPPSNRDAP